jgi:hypothetical protein
MLVPADVQQTTTTVDLIGIQTFCKDDGNLNAMKPNHNADMKKWTIPG